MELREGTLQLDDLGWSSVGTNFQSGSQFVHRNSEFLGAFRRSGYP